MQSGYSENITVKQYIWFMKGGIRNHEKGYNKNATLWGRMLHFYCSHILSEPIRNTLVFSRKYFKNQCALNLDFGKDFILVVLVDAQIPFCDAVSGMVINAHQQSRRSPLFPGVIAESLSQGMAADIGVQPGESGGVFYDSIGLEAAQGL